MGNYLSKDKIKMPNEYKLIKIISYNVRLIFNSPYRAKKIGYYLLDNDVTTDNEVKNDIICLQGLYDNESRKIIIDILSKYFKNVYHIENKINKLSDRRVNPSYKTAYKS